MMVVDDDDDDDYDDDNDGDDSTTLCTILQPQSLGRTSSISDPHSSPSIALRSRNISCNKPMAKVDIYRDPTLEQQD
jgi:hypothetical protein